MRLWQHDQVARSRDQVTEAWLEKDPMESKQLFYEASPLTYTTIDNTQTRFWCCGARKTILLSPVRAFVTALKQARFLFGSDLSGAAHFRMWDPIDERPATQDSRRHGSCGS